MRMKANLAYRTGDLEEANRLANKLKPDDPNALPPQAPQ